MAPTLRCLAILHTIISFLCVVGYYYLKVQQLITYFVHCIVLPKCVHFSLAVQVSKISVYK